MKKLYALLFSAFMLLANNARADVNPADAENFVKNVTQTGIEELINSNASTAEKKERFTKLIVFLGIQT